MTMSKVDARRIVDERLGRWGNRLVGEVATPVFLMGVRHEAGHVGEPVLCMTADAKNEDIAALLLAAAEALLQAGALQGNGRWEVERK